MWKLSPKIFFLTLSFVLLANQSVVYGATLICKYESNTGFIGIDGSVYFCRVQDTGIFTDARVRIDSVEGVHVAGHTIANVKGLIISFPSLKFFPKNLENIFDDFLAIQIVFTNLQEIKQEDVKVFPKLRYLFLGGNKITSIDQDLFKFNPELRYIYLYNNQITHIDPNVFDHLSHLSTLHLGANRCKSALSDANSRSDVLQLIQRVRNGECTSETVLQKKKAAQEQTLITANEECSAKYESVIDEKTKQITELREKLSEVEKINDEKIKINAELNKNLREQNEKLQADNNYLKMDFNKIQSTNQKLKTTVDNLKNDLGNCREKCESKVGLLESHSEKLRESNDKMNELKDKYTNLVEAKHTELNECKDKMIELNEKYTSLLNAKLIESEKTVEMQNEKLRNMKKMNSVDDEQKKSISGESCMTLWFNNQQTPIILVN